MLISYIIPVYNGEKYLRRCIDSLIQQDYGDTSHEIICIDDCSMDSSKEIINEYQKINPNVILIENKVNLKTGTVCNVGLDNAKGDYIWIIGQDDWIHESSIKTLSQIVVSTKPEVIAFNYRRVDFSENELHSAEVFDNYDLVNGAHYIRSKFGVAFPHYLLGYEWRAIFNREYLKQNNIRFPEGGIYEDTTFLFKAMLYSHRFVAIADFLYFYRVNPHSITDYNKKNKGFLIAEFAFRAGNEVLDLANELKDTYPDFSKQLYEMAKWYFNNFAPKLIGASFREKINFYKEVTQNKHLIAPIGSYLNPISRILLLKFIGLIIANTFKPIYLLKKKVIDRKKYKQEWCY